MRIGVIANSNLCLPLLHYLKSNQAAVSLYLGKTKGSLTEQEGVKVFCQNYQIPCCIEIEKETLYSWLNALGPDIVFIIGYSYRIKVDKLDTIRGGVYNIHFGPLPGYRGAHPLFWQLKSGVSQVGLVIHTLTQELDAGDIVWEKSIPNEEYFSFTFLNQVLSNTLIEGVHVVLSTLLAGKSLPSLKQDESKAVYYPKPDLIDVLIDWDKMPGLEIINLIKACSGWNTGAATSFGGMEAKIMDAALLPGKAEAPVSPGTILVIQGHMIVCCQEQELLQIFSLTLNGVFVPARFAEKIGLTAGSRFVSPVV